MKDIIQLRIQESIDMKNQVKSDDRLIELVGSLAKKISDCIKKGGKLVVCGNGGSASDASHFAGEIVGRFQKERFAWPAMALNADGATMTAIANDYGYDDVFSRQVQAHVRPNDVFLGISTSGNSQNVLKAVETAKMKGATTAALLGKDGGQIGRRVDYPIVVPCDVTARIQEVHILLIHIICEIVEVELAD